ncbi:hypothetical protein NMY22_g6862 [Coprinellus aureogranulatus]|nr:hypothetical protein NMY22_g6862 [Coprinellus aureogranulatus]
MSRHFHTDLFTIKEEPMVRRSSGTLILVMGQSGAGKSHFISSVAGKNIVPACSAASSKGVKVQSFTFDNPEMAVEPGTPHSRTILVDTPGLSNSNYSGHEAIKMAARWLDDNCEEDALVGGIIFIHDLAGGDRLWPVDCFDSPALLQHLVYTTSGWDQDFAQKYKKLFIEREQELRRTSMWRKMLKRGAVLRRYEGNRDSAWGVINALLEKPALEAALVQKDLYAMSERLALRRPKPPALLRLAMTVLEFASSIDFLSVTRTMDTEGRQEVTVVTAGNLEILSGAQHVQVETVTATSAGRDLVTQSITTSHYHFHGPVTIVVGSDAGATTLLSGLPNVQDSGER